jgi:hypothetical protein
MRRTFMGLLIYFFFIQRDLEASGLLKTTEYYALRG